MGLYKQKLNGVTGKLNLVPTANVITFKEGVANQAALPLSGNTQNDARIAADTGILYVWSIAASTGLLTDWVSQGDIVDLKWAAIEDKPSSSVSNIDDAVSKKHAHANSSALDLVSGTNTGDQVIPDKLSDLSDDATHRLVTDTEKSNWNGKQNALGFTPEDVSNKDTTTTLGTSDTKYPSQKAVKTYVDALGISTNTIRDLTLNIMLNAFRIAQQGSLALLNMVDQFVDEYEDESGVDTINSVNQSYDSSDDFYTPSTDSYTKLLLHLDNNVTDVIGKTVTNNNVTFSDTVKKFGTHSAVFNGSSAYLTLLDSEDWNFGTDDFTIDGWIYVNSLASDRTFFSQDGSPNEEMALIIKSNGTIEFVEAISGSNVVILTSSASIVSTDSWHHIAIVRHGVDWNLYYDGTSVASTSFAGSSYNYSGTFCIGASIYLSSFSTFLNGYIDEFRVSKGIARWTSDFTPPTEVYAIQNNMILLSNAQTAEAAPTSARLVLFEEDVDTITLNTDIKGYVSRDNGTTYSEVTLEDCGNYVSGAQILQGVVDISAQPSGTNMKYKIETLNNKDLKLHGAAISWR